MISYVTAGTAAERGAGARGGGGGGGRAWHHMLIIALSAKPCRHGRRARSWRAAAAEAVACAWQHKPPIALSVEPCRHGRRPRSWRARRRRRRWPAHGAMGGCCRATARCTRTTWTLAPAARRCAWAAARPRCLQSRPCCRSSRRCRPSCLRGMPRDLPVALSRGRSDGSFGSPAVTRANCNDSAAV